MVYQECLYRSSFVEAGKAYEGCSIATVRERAGDDVRVSQEPGISYKKSIDFLCKHCRVPLIMSKNQCEHLSLGLKAKVKVHGFRPNTASGVKPHGACSLTRKAVKPMQCYLQCSNYSGQIEATPQTPTQGPPQW